MVHLTQARDQQKKTSADRDVAIMTKYLESFHATASYPLPSWEGWNEKFPARLSQESGGPLLQATALKLGIPTMEMFQFRYCYDDVTRRKFIGLVRSFSETRVKAELRFLKDILKELKIERDVLEPKIRKWFKKKSASEQAAILRSGWHQLPEGDGGVAFLFRVNGIRPNGTMSYTLLRNDKPSPAMKEKQLKFPFWQEQKMYGH